jgi:hypothetical protein
LTLAAASELRGARLETRRSDMRPFLLLAIALAASSAAANPVYKCRSDEGKVTYSQIPCYGENWQRMGERPATPKEDRRQRPLVEKSSAAPATAVQPTALQPAPTAGTAPKPPQ